MNTSYSLPELVSFLLPAAVDLRLEALEVETLDPSITIIVTSTQPTSLCPSCHQPATRVHSHYHRTLADVPWATAAIRLFLHVRRFFCPTPGCAHRIFTERLPALVMPSARRTDASGLSFNGDIPRLLWYPASSESSLPGSLG